MNDDGEERQRSGSQAVLWCGLAVVAAPVLYLLTMPVVAVLVIPPTPAPTLSSTSSYTFSPPAPPPKWFLTYAIPAGWVATESPLKRPYQAYLEWCFKKLGR